MLIVELFKSGLDSECWSFCEGALNSEVFDFFFDRVELGFLLNDGAFSVIVLFLNLAELSWNFSDFFEVVLHSWRIVSRFEQSVSFHVSFGAICESESRWNTQNKTYLNFFSKMERSLLAVYVLLNSIKNSLYGKRVSVWINLKSC